MTQPDQETLASALRTIAALMSRYNQACMHSLLGDQQALFILAVTRVPFSAVRSYARLSSAVVLPDGLRAPSTPAPPPSENSTGTDSDPLMPRGVKDQPFS